MKIIRAEECPLVAWKNGGGLTREIATFSDPARHNGFLWRVSQAIVDRPGAFSFLEGIDRTIAVLEGGGIILANTEKSIRLDCTSLPYSFAGEDSVEATLIDGATTDLNIMTRRGLMRHKMEKIIFSKKTDFECIGDHTVIVCNSKIVTITGHKIYRFDTVSGFTKGDRVEATTQDEAEIFIISLF